MKPASCCATGAFCSPVTIPHSQRDPSQAKTLATFRILGPADQSPWQLTGHDGVDLVALGSVALEGLLKSGTIRGVLGSELRLGERDAEVGELADRIAADGEPALFVSRTGGRLSARSADRDVRLVAAAAGLELSAHTLRHTCLTALVRRVVVRAPHGMVLMPFPGVPAGAAVRRHGAVV